MFQAYTCVIITSSLLQGCQIGSFEKQLAPKFLFGYLATFWLFYNFSIPQIFLGEELRVVRAACSRHHKTRIGPPYSCVMLDNNRHRGFCNGVGLGPQDYRHFL